MDKFQIKTRYDDSYANIKDLILKRSGIVGEDRDFFLNPDHSRDIEFKPADLDRAVSLFTQWINTYDSNIGLLVDPDVDGYTSGIMMYKYLTEYPVNIHIYQQEGKEHGLTDYVLEDILEDDIDLLIITDAGTNDVERQELLLAAGIDILIIDHHQIEDDFLYEKWECPVINNQRKDNYSANPELTGVGMTLRFLEAVEERYLYEYYYLAMLGQIGDSSDVSEPEIRNIVVKGIENIPEDSFVEYILLVHMDGRDYTQRDMSFTINPLINAMVRVGKEEEKMFIFNTFAEDNPEDFKEGYKMLERVKRRQKTIVDRMKKDLTNNIVNTGGVAVGYVENPENKTVVGLVANQLVNSLNKPVLLLRDGDNGLSGSGRGLERVIPSLKDWCENTGLTKHIGGHDNAFGLSIEERDWDNLLEMTKDVKKLDYVYNVDQVYEEIDEEIVEEYDSVRGLVGGKIEEAKICVSNLSVDKNKIKSRGSVTLFFANGVEYIIFNDFGETANELKRGFGETVNIDIIGKPNINHWMGRAKPQIVVEDLQRANGNLFVEDIRLPEKKVDVDTVVF